MNACAHLNVCARVCALRTHAAAPRSRQASRTTQTLVDHSLRASAANAKNIPHLLRRCAPEDCSPPLRWSDPFAYRLANMSGVRVRMVGSQNCFCGVFSLSLFNSVVAKKLTDSKEKDKRSEKKFSQLLCCLRKESGGLYTMS